MSYIFTVTLPTLLVVNLSIILLEGGFFLLNLREESFCSPPRLSNQFSMVVNKRFSLSTCLHTELGCNSSVSAEYWGCLWTGLGQSFLDFDASAECQKFTGVSFEGKIFSLLLSEVSSFDWHVEKLLGCFILCQRIGSDFFVLVCPNGNSPQFFTFSCVLACAAYVKKLVQSLKPVQREQSEVWKMFISDVSVGSDDYS